MTNKPIIVPIVPIVPVTYVLYEDAVLIVSSLSFTSFFDCSIKSSIVSICS